MCWSVQPLLASTIQIPVNSCRSELWPNSIGKWTTLFDAKSIGLVLDDDAWLGWQQHLVRIITSPHSQWNLPVLVCWSHLVRKKKKAVARIRWNVRYWVGQVKFTSVHVEFSICLQACKTGFGHNYWMKSLSNGNWLMLEAHLRGVMEGGYGGFGGWVNAFPAPPSPYWGAPPPGRQCAANGFSPQPPTAGAIAIPIVHSWTGQ